MGKCFYKRFICFKNFNEYFMYLFRWRKGGCSLMHVYVLEHIIISLSSRTAWWIFMKLGKDEVLMVPYKCCRFSARSVQGRIQGGAKIGHSGSPSSTNFFFGLEGYSNKPNAYYDLEACGMKCCSFWFHSEVKFLTRFLRLFGLSHFALFQCNFYRFLCGIKCLIYIYFV